MPKKTTPTTSDKKEPLITRRKFLVGSALAVGAAVTYSYTMEEDAPKEEPKDTQTGPVLSIEEAKRLYLDLKRQVEEKYAEAKAANKPLRIVVMESHHSHNALAYNLMLMDISKRLGINKLLLENSSDTLDTLLDPLKSKQFTMGNPAAEKLYRQLLSTAQKKEMHMVAVDNHWPTAEDMTKGMVDIVARLMRQQVTQKYHIEGYKFQVHVNPQDQRLERARFSISGTSFIPPVDFSPGSPQREEFNGYFETALRQAKDVARAERDKVMRKAIEQHGDAVLVIGKNHGISLLPAMRKDGAVVIAFSPAVSKESEEQYLNNPRVSKKQKAALRWANNPANANQQEGKDFPAENLPMFISRVAERANEKQRGGR